MEATREFEDAAFTLMRGGQVVAAAIITAAAAASRTEGPKGRQFHHAQDL